MGALDSSISLGDVYGNINILWRLWANIGASGRPLFVSVVDTCGSQGGIIV